MVVPFDIIKKCFTKSLLIYSCKFIRITDSKFLFANLGSKHISSYWFSKVAFLIRNHNYDYKELDNVSFLIKNYKKSKKSFSLKLNVIEFSFTILIVSFFKFFSSSSLNKYV